MKKGMRVLIIEDSPSQAAIIADVARELKLAPVVYTELSVGVTQILLKEQPELVLLDLRLLDAEGNPTADGFQICREIKRFPSKPPVVVISAEDDEEACEWALLQGADAYLQKPFAVEDLAAALRNIFGGTE